MPPTPGDDCPGSDRFDPMRHFTGAGFGAGSCSGACAEAVAPYGLDARQPVNSKPQGKTNSFEVKYVHAWQYKE